MAADSKKGIYIAGGLLLVAIAAVVIFLVIKKKKAAALALSNQNQTATNSAVPADDSGGGGDSLGAPTSTTVTPPISPGALPFVGLTGLTMPPPTAAVTTVTPPAPLPPVIIPTNAVTALGSHNFGAGSTTGSVSSTGTGSTYTPPVGGGAHTSTGGSVSAGNPTAQGALRSTRLLIGGVTTASTAAY